MMPVLKMIPKQVIIYIVLVVLSLAVGAFGGYTLCKRAQYTGVIKQQKKDAVNVAKHQENKDAVDEKVRSGIDALRKIPDASGCLNKSNSDIYLDELQRTDSISKSGFN